MHIYYDDTNNLPESTEEQRTDKLHVYDDTKRVNELIQDGVNVPGVNVTRLIRFGGRGPNQQDKPRLILATLDGPDRRRAILSAARCYVTQKSGQISTSRQM